MKNEGRFAVIVDGIAIPGHDSMDDAASAIKNDAVLRGKGAVATGLSGSAKGRKYSSDYRPPGTAQLQNQKRG